MNPFTTGYAVVTIGDDVYTLDVFENSGKLLTTNLKLPPGEYTMTEFKLYSTDGMLMAEDLTPKPFTVEISFTFELPVELSFSQGPGTALPMVLVGEGLDYGYAYVKSDELPSPPEPEEVSVSMIGLLGIPENEFWVYEDHDIYSQRPVTSVIKCLFAVQHYHVNADGTVDEMVSFTSNYHTATPVEFTYTKSNDPNQRDVFKLQCYRALDTGDGLVIVGVVGPGLDSEWQIALNGDEDFILNDEGLVEFSMYPDDTWISDTNYQFTYQIY